MIQNKPITFNIFHRALLHSFNPLIYMSCDTSKELDVLNEKVRTQLILKSSQLRKNKQSRTMTLDSVQDAVKSVFNGELVTRAHNEGIGSINYYKNDHKCSVIVGSILKQMKKMHKIIEEIDVYKRIQDEALVYLMGCLNYLMSEIIEVGVDKTLTSKKKTLTKAHLQQGIEDDKELKLLFDTINKKIV